MNVIVLHGSARKGGDTDMLAEHLVRGLGGDENNAVTHFRPIDMQIAHCRGEECMGCSTGNGCVVQDDMQQVYPVFREADVVVMAAPMFWGYMTSQLKTLFDRFEAVVSPEYFGGKDFVLLIGYRHYYGSMVEWLERITKGFGSRSHALLCRTFDPDTGKDVPITETPARLDEAFRLGAQISNARAG